jgi:hypothetical protein
MRTGFLAHHQSAESRPTTFIPKRIADELIHRCMAERISQKLIRAFAPDSPFRLLPSIEYKRSIPAKLPPVELPNTKRKPAHTEDQTRREMRAFYMFMARKIATETHGPEQHFV